MIERIKQNKSLVDIKLTARACQEQIALAQRQNLVIHFFNLHRGNNGMVVRYILVGDHGLHQREEIADPVKGGTFAARWMTQEAVSAMSEVRYRLSVRG